MTSARYPVRTNPSAFFSVLSALGFRGLPALACALLLMIPGPARSASDDDPTAQLSKLQSVLFAFADNYMTGIAQATFDVRQTDPADPELRLRMHNLKLVITAAVQDLAVQTNPESTLLDMMVFATLHRIVFEGDAARELYGDGVDLILKEMKAREKEIWDIADDYFSPTQIAEVRGLIRDWRATHTDTTIVAYIRFHDFAGLRAQSPLVEKARKGGFLVDTSGAEKAVDDVLLLAERALHYSQRLPWIIRWQVEGVFYQMAVEPEFRTTLAQTQSATSTLNRFANAVEKLPQQINVERQATIDHLASTISEQRSQFFAELDSREEMMVKSFGALRDGLADADKLTVNLEKTTSKINEALINADKLMARFEQPTGAVEGPSEPFDIDSYVDAIRELTVAIQEANTLILSTERLTAGDSMMTGIFDRVLWTGTILIVILCVAVFITMLIYRAAARHIVPRSSFEYVGPPPEKKEKN